MWILIAQLGQVQVRNVRRRRWCIRVRWNQRFKSLDIARYTGSEGKWKEKA